MLSTVNANKTLLLPKGWGREQSFAISNSFLQLRLSSHATVLNKLTLHSREIFVLLVSYMKLNSPFTEVNNDFKWK